MRDLSPAPCNICFDLNEIAIRGKCDEEGFYTYCLQELVQSAKQCSTCDLIMEACKHCHPQAVDNSRVYTLSFAADAKLSSESLSLGIWPTEGVADMTHRTSRKVNIYAKSGEPCPWPLFKPWSGISKARNHLAEQILSWTNDCERNHEDCRVSHAPILPKRVVKIVPDMIGALKVRLVEPQPLTESRYACLSHCWGKTQILRTVSENIERLKDEIPWNSLSKTFQDAIEFSRTIGIEYIWIDSLCIIQDSANDWEGEAAKMADYYANCHITLAATASIDGSVGFFPKLPEYDEPLEIQGVYHGQRYHLIAETAISHPYEVQPDSLLTPEFPLMTRGWVYQEQTLSRRYVHFCAKEVVWDCRSQTLCQCESKYENTHWDIFRTNSSRSIMRNNIKSGSAAKQRELWYDNIMSMMDLEFTYLSDRLPAMAGIVSQFAELFNTRYLAGLWEASFIIDSCWFMDEFSRRPKELRNIPSWSWASVTGGIDVTWCQRPLTDDTVNVFSKVLHIDCVSVGSLYLGRLGKCLVTLRGPSVNATIRVRTNDEPNPSPEKLFALNFDSTGDINLGESVISGWSFNPDAPNAETNICNDGDLRIIKMMAGHLKRTGKEWGIFLVVQKVENHDNWERIGLLFGNSLRQNQVSKKICFLKWFEDAAQEQVIQIQ
ncbi:heterokaryon incompatibility domain-containing protein [Trichoderma evansii]